MSRTIYNRSFKGINSSLWNYSSCHRSLFKASYSEEEQCISMKCDKCDKECFKIAVLKPFENEIHDSDHTVSYRIRNSRLFLRLVPRDPDQQLYHVATGREDWIENNPVFVAREREHFSLGSISEYLRWMVYYCWCKVIN